MASLLWPAPWPTDGPARVSGVDVPGHAALFCRAQMYSSATAPLLHRATVTMRPPPPSNSSTTTSTLPAGLGQAFPWPGGAEDQAARSLSLPRRGGKCLHGR
jgi:hypothetical protein